MLQRFKASLSQPKSLFSYKDDRKRIVFLYVLILLIISMIPHLILQVTQGTFDHYEMITVEQSFQTDVMNKDNIINNGVMYSNETFDTMLNFFVFTNDDTIETFYMVVFFGETHIQLKLGDDVIEEVSYMDVLPQYDFSDDTLENASVLMRVIQTFLNNSAVVTGLTLTSIALSFILDYVMITFFLVFIMQMNRQVQNIPFKTRFKLGFYMSTPYMLTSLILVLFGFGQLTFVSLFIAYIYYVWAYRGTGGNHAQV